MVTTFLSLSLSFSYTLYTFNLHLLSSSPSTHTHTHNLYTFRICMYLFIFTFHQRILLTILSPQLSETSMHCVRRGLFGALVLTEIHRPIEVFMIENYLNLKYQITWTMYEYFFSRLEIRISTYVIDIILIFFFILGFCTRM